MLGRFLAIDPAAGKNPGWSPYVYTLDNPMKYVDPTGTTPEEREKAVRRSEEHVTQNVNKDKYEYGAKSGPGENTDCSGMVSDCVTASGVADPNHGPADNSGVQNYDANTRDVANSDVQSGNAVLFNEPGKDTPSHIGLVTGVTKDNQGNLTKVAFNHSGTSTGPTSATIDMTRQTGYWTERLHGFKAWDTPDAPTSASGSAAASTATGAPLSDMLNRQP